MKKLVALLKQTYYTLAIITRRMQAQLQPHQAGSYHDLGRALVAQEQWQSAVEACQQSITLDPHCPWFYKTLSEAYIGQGLWQQAIAASQTGIALSSQNSPEAAWLLHTLAKAYLGQEQWQAAIEACQRAIQLDSQSWFYACLGEALLKSGQWEAAVAPLNQAIQLDPHFPWTYYYLGEALLAQEKITAAIEVYQQVVQQHPEVDYLKSCLEYAQHLQTQEQRIQAYCQKALQTPQTPDCLRILMLTPYPTYPPKLGAIARMFHEMQALGARHELVVVSFIFMKGDYRLEADLTNYCELGLTVMIGDAPPRQPDQPKLIHRYSSERMRKLLHLLQPANFDVFLCDFIYMAQYQDLFPDAYAVLSEHNIESQLLQRCAAVNQNNAQLEQLAQQTAAVKAFVESDTEAKLLAVYENEYWKKFDLRMVVSQQDRQEMNVRCDVGQTLIVNNGIDTENIELINNSTNQKILFIGTMSYYPNIDGASYFVEQILPILWQHNPKITFCIAGAEPPQAILDLTQDPRISVIANPDNMSDVAETCQMTVVPLRIGGGTRIKILHSMAMGLPVVSTRLGCEGLAVTDGMHLLVRDQPEDFAVAVLQLLADAKLQQNLRQNGRALVEQTYDWKQIFAAAAQEIGAGYRHWKASKTQKSQI